MPKVSRPTPPKFSAQPKECLKAGFDHYIRYSLNRDKPSDQDLYQALALSVREQLMDNWRDTRVRNNQFSDRKVAYLSLEFLMGRALGNAALNLNLTDDARQALKGYGARLEEVAEQEQDAGLGNGGLGRLAACFLDSCATLDMAVLGYGIRYEYGMFTQQFVDGHQVEQPDRWLRNGTPWEVKVPHHNVLVQFGGRADTFCDDQGRRRHHWVDTEEVLAVAYDVPIPGFNNRRVNTLRLWKAEATDEFDLSEFNQGDYSEAVARKNQAEQITMVLYPNDSSENGKELRLRQQYFLSSASLQDLLRSYLGQGGDVGDFAKHHVIQLNDTHPSISVAELMRLLMDEYGLGWDQAWSVSSRTLAYTNHTLLPEALESWPVALMQRLLPRLMEIIFEINARFLEQVAQRWPGDGHKLRQLSIISDDADPAVRMAHLAIVGSFSVNGVAMLHTTLLTQGLFHHFHQLWPQRFNNKTNGVTPRRWLAHANPRLSALLTERLGKQWITDLSQLTALNAYLSNDSFIHHWREIKQANKQRLAQLVYQRCNVEFDTGMLFDVQVKRIHEYKRQLLNLLHVIHLYRRITAGDTANMTPRCVLIGGKAAPGYALAKRILKLANNVAYMINADARVRPFLRVAVLPDYNVSAMEIICPGADLSQQISTAGKEASGTGNMKLMMNGALTIGTLDGANIEILDAVGSENFFLFGLNAQEVEQARQHYQPDTYLQRSPALRGVIELLQSGHFNLLEPGLFQPILDALLSPADPWMVLADFDAYLQAQERVAEAYLNPAHWTRMSIRNTAASGRFSSDATISRYRDEIWSLAPARPCRQGETPDA
ncbi:glycogen/starch/alpha-glucan phosphorylase [Ferrimonas sp. SCSIO 43195]|uniref:glycogen/starch/alpha-glucan phosphorylase n=1 Tax=Ferrimonas sp. SCSIO 43195 TaxID=2822844 RepID=UPI0020759358|nr:glycogen/starch/alpha-glucan phosphorylase [Ferrimonas sp. SCSIO 43195]USD36446.1 glycogen/starch/alpha-glucan phosphorylase [Ferrimonas sp. SCSIO 43195]